MKRRVLLIAYHYCDNVIGALRPRALVKYLPQFGWDALVVTPRRERTELNLEDNAALLTSQRDIVVTWKKRFGLHTDRGLYEQLGLTAPPRTGPKRLHTNTLEWAKLFLTYPDETKGWVPYAIEQIRELKRKRLPVDTIISTSPPISTHLVAAQAQRIFGAPWIADFRDLWVGNPNDPYGGLFSRLQNRLERKTLDNADVLITVSNLLRKELQERYVHKSVQYISNGFDPDEYLQHSRLTREFSITYTGQLYEGKRDPTPLLMALSELIASGIIPREFVRVRFYGPKEPWLMNRVRDMHVDDLVEYLDSLPRREALARQRESQILLLLGWNGVGGAGIVSGKIFEYLASSRPILCIGGEKGSITDLLEETKAGYHAFSVQDAKEFLHHSYLQFRQYGSVSYRGEWNAIRQYSHPEMTRQFAEVLNRLQPVLCCHPNHEPRSHATAAVQ